MYRTVQKIAHLYGSLPEAFGCMGTQAEMANGRSESGLGVRGVKSLLGQWGKTVKTSGRVI